jgi:catechol 2,3-dioxygenase-like lactoylglutathione lyase family enzyme
MDLKNSSTALFVKDIKASKGFYTGILGLTVDMDFGENVVFKNGITIWEVRNKHIIPAKLGLDKISELSVNRFEIYFETENLDDVFENLKSEGVRFLHEVHEEPWGQRTIRFFDPDNHLIEIGESMKQFVCRFYNQGLTTDQISERTSVPIQLVKQLIKFFNQDPDC